MIDDYFCKFMINIIVTSLNPVKIEAARLAFSQAFPQNSFEIKGCRANSGVSDQPLSDQETKLGVLNRIKSARLLDTDADFYFSFEGGAEDKEGFLEEFAWVAIEDKNGRTNQSRSATFIIPETLRHLIIHEGLEMGEAADRVFNDNNIKQKGGAVGALSKNLVTRTDLYVQAAILALLPWLRPELYSGS
jgi:inosine/xanthosine triphosphatase